jgi:hypothetical protein
MVRRPGSPRSREASTVPSKAARRSSAGSAQPYSALLAVLREIPGVQLRARTQENSRHLTNSRRSPSPRYRSPESPLDPSLIITAMQDNSDLRQERKGSKGFGVFSSGVKPNSKAPGRFATFSRNAAAFYVVVFQSHRVHDDTLKPTRERRIQLRERRAPPEHDKTTIFRPPSAKRPRRCNGHDS